MKPESYAHAHHGFSRTRVFEPSLVYIENPGYAGIGYVSFPTEQLARSRWLGTNVLYEWLLEGAVQVMRAVLASGGDEREPPQKSAVSLLEFEDIHFGKPVEANSEVQFIIRIQNRTRRTFRGSFFAYQGATLVADGTLVANDGWS